MAELMPDAAYEKFTAPKTGGEQPDAEKGRMFSATKEQPSEDNSQNKAAENLTTSVANNEKPTGIVSESGQPETEGTKATKERSIEQIIAEGPKSPSELARLSEKLSAKELRDRHIEERYGKGPLGKWKATLAGESTFYFDSNDKLKSDAWGKIKTMGARAAASILNKRVAASSLTAAGLSLLTGGIGVGTMGTAIGSGVGRLLAEVRTYGQDVEAVKKLREAQGEYIKGYKDLLERASKEKDPTERSVLLNQLTKKTWEKDLSTALENLRSVQDSSDKTRDRYQKFGQVVGALGGVSYEFMSGNMLGIKTAIDPTQPHGGLLNWHSVVGTPGNWGYLANQGDVVGQGVTSGFFPGVSHLKTLGESAVNLRDIPWAHGLSGGVKIALAAITEHALPPLLAAWMANKVDKPHSVGAAPLATSTTPGVQASPAAGAAGPEAPKAPIQAEKTKEANPAVETENKKPDMKVLVMGILDSLKNAASEKSFKSGEDRPNGNRLTKVAENFNEAANAYGVEKATGKVRLAEIWLNEKKKSVADLDWDKPEKAFKEVVLYADAEQAYQRSFPENSRSTPDGKKEVSEYNVENQKPIEEASVKQSDEAVVEQRANKEKEASLPIKDLVSSFVKYIQFYEGFVQRPLDAKSLGEEKEDFEKIHDNLDAASKQYIDSAGIKLRLAEIALHKQSKSVDDLDWNNPAESFKMVADLAAGEKAAQSGQEQQAEPAIKEEAEQPLPVQEVRPAAQENSENPNGTSTIDPPRFGYSEAVKVDGDIVALRSLDGKPELRKGQAVMLKGEDLGGLDSSKPAAISRFALFTKDNVAVNKMIGVEQDEKKVWLDPRQVEKIDQNSPREIRQQAPTERLVSPTV